MIEIWKDIEGYENYQVSNLGRVRSLDRLDSIGRFVKGKMKNLTPDKDGYLLVNLYKNGINKACKVHRLVAQAFIPNHNNLPEVNHKDEDKTNNCIDNLEWCDRQYNCNYGNRNEIMGKKHRKPILQLTIDGCLVGKWDGIKEASTKLNYVTSCIGRCCQGKQSSAYGFVWKYYDLDTYLIGKMNRNIKEKRMAC